MSNYANNTNQVYGNSSLEKYVANYSQFLTDDCVAFNRAFVNFVSEATKARLNGFENEVDVAVNLLSSHINVFEIETCYLRDDQAEMNEVSGKLNGELRVAVEAVLGWYRYFRESGGESPSCEGLSFFVTVDRLRKFNREYQRFTGVHPRRYWELGLSPFNLQPSASTLAETALSVLQRTSVSCDSRKADVWKRYERGDLTDEERERERKDFSPAETLILNFLMGETAFNDLDAIAGRNSGDVVNRLAERWARWREENGIEENFSEKCKRIR